MVTAMADLAVVVLRLEMFPVGCEGYRVVGFWCLGVDGWVMSSCNESKIDMYIMIYSIDMPRPTVNCV